MSPSVSEAPNSGSVIPREHERKPGSGHQLQIVEVNDMRRDELAGCYFDIENISRGGFRFRSEYEFELEDRIKVMLFFPDGKEFDVLGRICYLEEEGGSDEGMAYGFSIISGFYDI